MDNLTGMNEAKYAALIGRLWTAGQSGRADAWTFGHRPHKKYCSVHDWRAPTYAEVCDRNAAFMARPRVTTHAPYVGENPSHHATRMALDYSHVFSRRRKFPAIRWVSDRWDDFINAITYREA